VLDEVVRGDVERPVLVGDVRDGDERTQISSIRRSPQSMTASANGSAATGGTNSLAEQHLTSRSARLTWLSFW